MKLTTTLCTSLFALGTLTACSGGSSPYVDSPATSKGGSYQDAAPTTAGYNEAPGDYEQEAGPAAEPSPSPPPGAAARSDVDAGGDEAWQERPTQRRPGLATSWGERRQSRVSSAPFTRADRSSPFALGKIFYNDPDGIDAMTSSSHVQRGFRTFPVGGGHVELGLRDGSGRFMSGLRASGDNYVSAHSGHRYSIVVRNLSPGRIEAVISVDGLDVIDGKSASLGKRGYLIQPFGTLEVEGFRTSTTDVAAFRFGSVSNSYANRKHGETRNVGVIGLALFHERGDNPSFWGTPRRDDTDRRHDANPFPNTFAQPPN